jgi:hypothetical protein
VTSSAAPDRFGARSRPPGGGPNERAHHSGPASRVSGRAGDRERHVANQLRHSPELRMGPSSVFWTSALQRNNIRKSGL